LSRVQNVIKNAKVGLFFTAITFILGMYSRKVFLNELGPEFIGLTTTLLGIIGFLSLAEMGLSVAVSSTLYKPLAEKNYKKVCVTIDFLGKAYKFIGAGMVVLALIVALFLPYFFPGNEVSLRLVYFAYLAFIVTVVIEYVFNYRQIILSVDQKNYILILFRDGLNIVKVLLQLAVLSIGWGEYAWLAIGVMTSSVSIFLINQYIKNHYQWLVKTNKKIKTLYGCSLDVIKKTKQLMVHKLSGFINGALSNILIYKFSSLSMVAYIANYQILLSVIPMLLSSVKTPLTATVGNYVSTRREFDRDLFYTVFFAFSVCSFIFSFFFYFLSSAFIYYWLGDEFILNDVLVSILTLSLCIVVLRSFVDIYVLAYGIFDDVKSPFFEIAINVSVSLSMGYIYGVIGILLGPLFSVLIIVLLWRPFWVFKKLHVKEYLNYLFKLLCFLCFLVLSIIFTKYIVGGIDINGISASSMAIYFSSIVCSFIFAFSMYIIINIFELKKLKTMMLKMAG